MGILRTVGLGLLGLFFVLGLITANLAVAADRTVLNDDFVTDTAEEADLYAVIAEEIREEALAEAPEDASPDELPLSGFDFETLVEEAVTEEWVQSQFEPAIENVYAFLLGDSETLEVTIDTEELQDNAAEYLREEGELDLTAFPDERAAQIDRMTESPEQFEEERDQFRDERTAEIQEETDEELSEAELEAALDAELEDSRELIREQVVGAAPPDLPGAEEPLEALADAWVDAMLGEVEYEEFTATVETASDELLESFIDGFFEEAAPFPDSIEFTEDDIPAEERENLETVREALSLLTIVPFVLAGLVVALAGGIVVLATPGGAAIGLGAVTMLVGGGTAVGGMALRQQLPSLLASIPEALRGSIVTLVGAIVDVVVVQSVLLAVLGVLGIGVGIAIRRELILTDDRPQTGDGEPAVGEPSPDDTDDAPSDESAGGEQLGPQPPEAETPHADEDGQENPDQRADSDHEESSEEETSEEPDR